MGVSAHDSRSTLPLQVFSVVTVDVVAVVTVVVTVVLVALVTVSVVAVVVVLVPMHESHRTGQICLTAGSEAQYPSTTDSLVVPGGSNSRVRVMISSQASLMSKAPLHRSDASVVTVVDVVSDSVDVLVAVVEVVVVTHESQSTGQSTATDGSTQKGCSSPSTRSVLARKSFSPAMIPPTLASKHSGGSSLPLQPNMVVVVNVVSVVFA
jgi:hypothetical protein